MLLSHFTLIELTSIVRQQNQTEPLLTFGVFVFFSHADSTA